VTLIAAVLGAVLGAIVGSFLATLCLRWEMGQQAILGRSACDNCKRPLGPFELVPVLSYAVQRGKCRNCAARIAPEHVQVEVVAAMLGASALALSPDPAGAALALFGWILLPLAILDARNFWLPDRLTLVLAGAGMLLGGFVSGASLQYRLIGGLAGFLSLEVIRRAYLYVRSRDGLGGGDPKLLGAIGLWLGWATLPFVLLTASVAGLTLALAGGAGRWARFPFGAALAAAAWTVGAVQLLSAA
jgi:leader peptidase (prepilin peptidase) / N-methyltransferase